MASGGVHLLSGFAIGAVTPSPTAAFAAGLASHAVLDAVPHRDYVGFGANAIDGAAGLVLVGILAAGLPNGTRTRALAGALGAVLPDAEVLAYRAGIISAERKVFPTHTGRIRHGRGGAAWTAALSVLAVVAAIAAARSLRDTPRRSSSGRRRK